VGFTNLILTVQKSSSAELNRKTEHSWIIYHY